MDFGLAEELRRRCSAEALRWQAKLRQLVAIPSVSSSASPEELVHAAAETATVLAGAGCEEVRLLETGGGPPAVFARGPRRPGPSVLLYAHYDVQPAGDLARWMSPPFVAVERDGRLYGRGSSDDKAGIVTHAAALSAWGDEVPISVSILVEGEEEVGSPHLGELLATYSDLLRADVVVLADCGNWDVGEPALTTSLRGLVDCTVEVRTGSRSLHSGIWGGPIPDALSALVRILCRLLDDHGGVAVGGLPSAPPSKAGGPPIDEMVFRAQAGLLDGVELIGSGNLRDRLWYGPAITVIGIDAPSVAQASNQLLSEACAKVSLRLEPNTDPDLAMAALQAHLVSSAPWGVHVEVQPGARAAGCSIDWGPVHDAYADACEVAWGKRPWEIGSGGSIPFVSAFLAQMPEASFLLTGVEDPSSNAHGENESVHLEDLERASLAEAAFLGILAERFA